MDFETMDIDELISYVEFDLFDQARNEIKRRCEPSPIVKAMMDEDNGLILGMDEDAGSKFMYFSNGEFKVWNRNISILETDSESEAITALLSD